MARLGGRRGDASGLTAALEGDNVTGMAVSPAEKQARYRARQRALMQSEPDVAERALLEEAARCEQLSVEQRVALADKLADLANRHLWRAQKLAELARKVRPPDWIPPGFPPRR
jgi:hypothetical protein